MAKELTEKQFRDIVLVMAMCQNLIDVVDLDYTKHLFKGDSKRKLNMAVKSIERDTRKYINKLYETDDILFQALQEAAEKNLKYLIDNEIETVVNEANQ